MFKGGNVLLIFIKSSTFKFSALVLIGMFKFSNTSLMTSFSRPNSPEERAFNRVFRLFPKADLTTLKKTSLLT